MNVCRGNFVSISDEERHGSIFIGCAIEGLPGAVREGGFIWSMWMTVSNPVKQDHRQQEEIVADAIVQSMVQRGCTPSVDFQDPDVIITVELVGDECGIGLMTKSLRERYPFVKVS
jgi:hypothetical protein